MAATPGYNATIELTGAPASMTDEAMSEIGSTDVYYIDDSTKNLFDPEGTFVVEDGGGTVPTDEYSIDYLLGQVTFTTSPTGAVTITGDYLPRYTIGVCYEAAINPTRQMLEDTTFGDTAMSRLAGLHDITGSLSLFDFGLTDFDTGGSSGVTIYAALTNGTAKALSISLDDSDDEVIRLLTLFESDEVSSSVEDLVMSTLTFQGILRGALDVPYSIGVVY